MSKKKLYDEDGNEVKGAKVKKPFYKRWWFIALVVIVIIVAFSGGGEEDTASGTEEPVQEESTTDEANEESGEEDVEQESDGLLAIGESATIDDITFTVTGSSFTDERNEFAETNPEQVIKIDFSLENGAEEDYPVGMDTQVYVDGTQADSYPLGSDIGSVSAGRTFEGSIYYGVNGDSVELEWEPMMSFSGDKAIWDITPQ